MTVESSFIPFPSEVVVPPAAYKASQPDSGMHIAWVVVFATLGALLGSLINYFLALWLGRILVYRFAESQLGHLCLLSAEKVQKAEDYFVRHGKASTFIGRLVPAVRQLISLPAGLSRMPLHTFLLYTFLGAGAWNIVLAALGYVAQGNAGLISRYNKELSWLLLALGVAFVLYLLYNAFHKKKNQA
jgi:membrane protein DedA with SNARE-associated domain